MNTLSFRAMGCQMNVWSNSDSLLEQVPAWVEDLEQVLSRFRPGSELMRLNARLQQWVNVSPVLFDVIKAAKQAARLTEGLYNPLVLSALVASGYDRSFELIQQGAPAASSQQPPVVGDWRAIRLDMDEQKVWLPSAIDLGGIGKGWTAQHIVDCLAPFGACMVDAGGDIVTRGRPAGEEGWLINVAEPGTDEKSAPVAVIQVEDAAIATSGIDYRRWNQGDRQQHHLIDPRTGEPAHTDVLTATVIHADAPTAEAYTKALVLMGSEPGLNWLNQQWYASGLVVRQDGAVLATSNFEKVMRREQ